MVSAYLALEHDMNRTPLRLAVFASVCALTFSMANANSKKKVEPLGRRQPTTTAPQATNVQSRSVLGHVRAPGFTTALSTDKPIYKEGEKVYIRGVLLEATTHKPMSNSFPVVIQIRGPKGESVGGGRADIKDSVWGFSWQVPAGQAGGEYVVRAEYPLTGFAPATRKFDVRAYRAPRLSSHITFLRDGYGPGEKVSATLEVKRAEGGFPSGAKVTVNALVDGIAIDGSPTSVDDKGLCTVNFELPREIVRGEGTLALTIEDGGVVETASKTIPILLKTVNVQMYPEGGDLVANLPNRVYVQALQPSGKPADLVAKVVAESGPTDAVPVTLLRTEHEGRGRFEFTPKANEKYFLKVVKPEGIDKLFPLPEVKSHGAVIRSESEVFKKDQPIKVQVGGTTKRLLVTLAKQDKIVASSRVKTNPTSKSRKTTTVEFTNTSEEVDGVLTVTVWDENDTPLAERLVFREPAKSLVVDIKTDKDSYVPGDNASVKIKTTDSDGKPVSAVVGVTVTDDSVLQMIEKREQAPRLPVMVFLEPEVKDLADAQIYLDQNNPKAELATDLLLGTQGWRRFALVDVEKFILANGDLGRRALAMTLPPAYQSSTRANRGRWAGVPMGAGVGKPSELWRKKPKLADGVVNGAPLALDPYQHILAPNQLIGARIGETSSTYVFMPLEIGRVEGPRDMNMFQVEPTVVDERHYSSGRSERHQKTSPTLPEGAPIPDVDGRVGALAQLNCVDRYTYFPSASTVMVREFAHQVRPQRNPNDRVDFTETLYWNAAVKTDAQSGEGTIKFGLNDSVTTFKVFADAFSDNGSIGASTTGLKANQPFYAEAKLPLEVTAGDKILLPISFVNTTSSTLINLSHNLSLLGSFRLLPLIKPLESLNAGDRSRCIQPIEVGCEQGSKEVVLNAKAGPYQDKVVRQINVKPSGFPVEQTFAGILEPGTKKTFKVSIEKNVVPESIETDSSIYPTPLANMTSALERLIQEPSGCFEQTSSTSYPLTMAQQYFLSHSGVAPKLVETSREKLDTGYKKLVSFWCPDRGYEWFGENPGHEALTAFGLLHFTDMSQVRDVDKEMIKTTRTWLMKQKDGKGGFNRNRRALHSWIEDKDCSNAYIVWALLETGQQAKDLEPELALLKSTATTSKNNYVVALAANAFSLAGDKATAKKLMQQLASQQKTDGSVDGITSSIVGSGGEALQIEGTSFATLAWLREPEFTSNVQKSIKFLADSCQGGRYGSTQSTVLALRAIVNYDKLHGKPKAPGKVQVFADGKPIGSAIAFDKSSQAQIKLPDLSELLSPGDHDIEISMDGGSPMPYAMAVKYNTLTPASAKECKLDIDVKLVQSSLTEGASTQANVTIANISDEAIPTPVAIVGLPGGLEPRHDQLKELVKKHTIDSYEVLGRDVVLYWRSMPAKGKVQVPLSLVAAIPGTYTGTASCAYLYYTDEHKKWVDGLHVDITPKSAIQVSSR